MQGKGKTWCTQCPQCSPSMHHCYLHTALKIMIWGSGNQGKLPYISMLSICMCTCSQHRPGSDQIALIILAKATQHKDTCSKLTLPT